MFADTFALRLKCYRKFKLKKNISTVRGSCYCYVMIRSDAAELVEIESRDPQEKQRLLIDASVIVVCHCQNAVVTDSTPGSNDR